MTLCWKRSISKFALVLCLSNDTLLCDFVTAGESGFVARLGMVQQHVSPTTALLHMLHRDQRSNHEPT